MSLTQILLALRARWWIAVLTLFLALGAAESINLLVTPKYKAIATVIVDYKGTETISGAPSVLAFSPAYLATQVDIIESHRVALRVVKNLKLADNAVARAQFKDATDGRGSVEDWLADTLLNNLKVTPSKESSVINLEYAASDAKFAALMANAFAKAYIDTHLELRTDPARDVATWFDGQLKELRGNLERAQTKLSEFQRSSGIVATDERVDVENAKLSELSSQVVALQGQTADVVSRKRQIEGAIKGGRSLDDVPEVGGNSMVMGLRGELVRMEGRLKDAAGQYGPNHPTYQRMVDEYEGVRHKLDKEMQSIATSVSVAARQQQAREADVRAQLGAQKSKVLELKRQRDEIAVFVRDVENAQRAYEAALSRFTQTNMESQANQTNLSLLNAAVEPLMPSSPRILLNLLVAAFLGTVMGMSLALGVEYLNARVRSEHDITTALQLQFLGKLGKSRGRKRLRKGLPRGRLPAAA